MCLADIVSCKSLFLWLKVVDMHMCFHQPLGIPAQDSALRLSFQPIKFQERITGRTMQHKNQGHKHLRILLPSVIKVNGFRKRASSLAAGRSGRILVTMAIPHSRPSSETAGADVMLQILHQKLPKVKQLASVLQDIQTQKNLKLTIKPLILTKTN